MDSLLISTLSRIDVFLLIFVRMLGFFMILPLLGGQNIPNRSKVAISLAMASLVLSVKTIDFVLTDDTLVTYVVLIFTELFVGLIMGFVVFMLFSMIYYVGQMVDYSIGFSMLSVLDPISQIQVPIFGNFLYFTISALILSVNGEHSFLSAIFNSYDVIPIGLAHLFNGNLMDTMIASIVAFFSIGYQIALPIIGAIFLIDVALGIMTKTSPQMHIFVVGLPIKLIVGLFIVFFVSGMYIDVSTTILNESMKAVMSVIKGMMP